MSLDQFLDRWKAIPIRVRGIGLLILLTVFLVGMAAQDSGGFGPVRGVPKTDRLITCGGNQLGSVAGERQL